MALNNKTCKVNEVRKAYFAWEGQQGLSVVELQFSVQLPWGINTGCQINRFVWSFARQNKLIMLCSYEWHSGIILHHVTCVNVPQYTYILSFLIRFIQLFVFPLFSPCSFLLMYLFSCLSAWALYVLSIHFVAKIYATVSYAYKQGLMNKFQTYSSAIS
jgi:hypothetical protein